MGSRALKARAQVRSEAEMEKWRVSTRDNGCVTAGFGCTGSIVAVSAIAIVCLGIIVAGVGGAVGGVLVALLGLGLAILAVRFINGRVGESIARYDHKRDEKLSQIEVERDAKLRELEGDIGRSQQWQREKRNKR